jgi:hypothetical protein
VTGAVSEQGTALPELVFVPAHPVDGSDARDIAVEVRRAADGSAVLAVFTTVDRLVATLGSYQPWVRMPLRAARAMVRAAGVNHVLVDPAKADTATLWTREDIDGLRREQRP